MKKRNLLILLLAVVVMVAIISCDDDFNADNAKEKFITDFNTKILDIEVDNEKVASAKLEKNGDIVVNFKTNDASDIKAGAEKVFEELQKLVKSNSEITINEKVFKLASKEIIPTVAKAILGDITTEGFNADGVSVNVDYEATVYVEGGSFKLKGKLTFNPNPNID